MITLSLKKSLKERKEKKTLHIHWQNIHFLCVGLQAEWSYMH